MCIGLVHKWQIKMMISLKLQITIFPSSVKKKKKKKKKKEEKKEEKKKKTKKKTKKKSVNKPITAGGGGVL